MKYLSFLFLIAISITSCAKKETFTCCGPEPVPPKIISKDTITTGQIWGLTIGQSSADIYTEIQEIKTEQKVEYLSVVGNVFTSLESLADKIPLYTEIFLDEQVGTSTGIQIYFADNKVKSIFNNNGVKMSKWPSSYANTSSVSVGDNISDVYAKLVNIKKMGTYANKFERISLFNKDFTKEYDPQMGNSRLWYLNGDITDERYYHRELNFSNGKLVSIYTTILENQ